MSVLCSHQDRLMGNVNYQWFRLESKIIYIYFLFPLILSGKILAILFVYFVVDEGLCVTKQTLSCDNYDNDIWEHYNQYLTRLCSVQHLFGSCSARGKGKHLMNEQTEIAIVVRLSFSIGPTSIFLIYMTLTLKSCHQFYFQYWHCFLKHVQTYPHVV